MTERDYGDELMFETLVVRLFPEDKQALLRIVKDHPEAFDNVSHAMRSAVQAFIRKWGEE